MTMPDTPDLNDLAEEYVLGTLPHADRQRVDAALAHDKALEVAVREWEMRLLPLVSLADPVTPQPALWERIEQAITATTEVSTGATTVKWWNSLLLWRGLAAGSMAAAAIMAVVLASSPQLRPESSFMVVLAAPESMNPGWVIQASNTNQLRLVPLGTSDVPSDKSLQFWTKAEGWDGPVSLGLVTPGKALELSLDKLPKIQPNQLFEITLEPKNGSPIGRPTGPILFIGRAAAV